MSATLRILVPDGTTNYVKNPAMRYSTTGYTAFGSTLTRVLDYARFGIASLKVVTNGTVIGEGVYYRVNWFSGLQGPMTGSVYLRGNGIVRLRLIDNNREKQWTSNSISLTSSRWKRYDVTGYEIGGNDVRMYIETDKKAQAITFYADGFQVEPKPYPTTYCDGDQPGCQWNIMKHGSISTRSAYTRRGGRWVNLVGCDRDIQDLYVTVAGGMGVAPITNNIQPYADAPGSFFQRAKIDDRVITFTFHAISKDLDGKLSKSLERLHTLRKTLFEIIKPDKTSRSEEFLIEYQDGPVPLYIGCRYDGGLEGEWDIRNKWKNSFPVRFLSISPFFTDDNQETANIDFQSWDTSCNYVAQRRDGLWSQMNGGLDAVVFEFAIGKQGELYACGQFVRANNSNTAIDPKIYANYVAYWDGTQWQKLGSGANGRVLAIDVAPNGDLYAAGEFTNIGGVACNRVAKWNGSAWSALGTGVNATANAVRVAPNGFVYVGGTFSQAGGFTARKCAYYENGTWHSMGFFLGLDDSVDCIAINTDGSQVFLGGDFINEYNNPANVLNRVALYDPLYNQFSAMGSGFDAPVVRLRVNSVGRLYACGNFTASGADPMLYIAYWNGSAWYNIGVGADNNVLDMDVSDDGTIIAVGQFTRMGSADAFYAAYWNGSTWVSLDSQLPGTGYAVIRDIYKNLCISFSGIPLKFSGSTIIQNPGTAEVSPSFYIVGPATLRWIENHTSERFIHADLQILSGEEITIDCVNGTVKSAIRGDISYAISPASDLRSWKLQPGENEIIAFMDADVGASMYLQFSTRHWSADSTSDAENI